MSLLWPIHCKKETLKKKSPRAFICSRFVKTLCVLCALLPCPQSLTELPGSADSCCLLWSNRLIHFKKVGSDSCGGERRQLQPFTTSETLLLEIISPAVIWHQRNMQEKNNKTNKKNPMHWLHFDPIAFPGMEKNQVRSAEVVRQLPLEPLISAAAARSSDRAEPPTPPPPARLCKVGTWAWSASSAVLLRRDPPPAGLSPQTGLSTVCFTAGGAFSSSLKAVCNKPTARSSPLGTEQCCESSLSTWNGSKFGSQLFKMN